jgi:hypothetical protein
MEGANSIDLDTKAREQVGGVQNPVTTKNEQELGDGWKAGNPAQASGATAGWPAPYPTDTPK